MSNLSPDSDFSRLTPRQQSVFGFIVEYKRAHDGNSPTVREIMAACGYHSTGTVNYTLRRLAEIGLIALPGQNQSRAIQVVGGTWKFEPEDETMATLKQSLSDAVALAEASRDQPKRITVRKDLRIDIKVGEETQLQLSRSEAYPDQADQRAVLEAWPYPVALNMPSKRFSHKGRWYVAFRWPTPARLME